MDPTPSLPSRAEPLHQPVLAVVPVEVDRLARCWDDQHLDLSAAARQVAGAPTTGFSRAVAPAADDFVAAWGQRLEGLADTAGSTAVALSAVTASLLHTDEGAARDSARLGARLAGRLRDAA